MVSSVSRGTLAQSLYCATGDGVSIRYVEAPRAGPDVGKSDWSVSAPFSRGKETVMVMFQSDASFESVAAVLSVVSDVSWELDEVMQVHVSLTFFLVQE